MHIDARELDDNSIIEGDICIVGAGAAGISIALEWMNTPYKVILLEGGGFEYADEVQELYNGKITGQPYYPMKSSRLHYFGGTTGHWGGMSTIFDEIDFEERDWVENSGWPIKYTELTSFYPRAHPILDLGPYEYSVSYWQKLYPLYKELPFDKDVLVSKMWQFSPPTRFGKKYKDTIVNAKNIHLYTYANVVNIAATENVSAVKELIVKNHAGKEHTVRAKHIILACCAIQNSRLLLASNKQARAGLGNDKDQVGRYFMEHPEIRTGELWLTNSDSLALYVLTDREPRAEISVTVRKQKELKILNGTVSLMPLFYTKNITPAVKTWSQDDPRKSFESFSKDLASADKSNIVQRLLIKGGLQSYGLSTRIEQVPNPSSRVVLSAEKDALGVPRANLHWLMTPIDKRTIRKLNELVGQQVGVKGIGRVKLYDFLLDENDESMPDTTGGGWHHMGTTRMSSDPKKGVVDADCKVHGIDNLYVAGASCFPTGGGSANPTLSTVAMSLRLSDHLKEKMKNS